MIFKMTKTINRATERDKEAFISSICEDIKDHLYKNKPRNLFHKITQLTQKFQLRSLPVREASGKLTKESVVIKPWQNYFSNEEKNQK